MFLRLLIPPKWRKAFDLVTYAFFFPVVIIVVCLLWGLVGAIEVGTYHKPKRLGYAALSAGTQQSGWYAIPNCSISVGAVSLSGADPQRQSAISASDSFYMPVYSNLDPDSPARLVIHTNDRMILETINAMWELKRAEKNYTLQQYANAHPERMWVDREVTGKIVSRNLLTTSDRLALSRIPNLAQDYLIIDDGYLLPPIKQSVALLSIGILIGVGTTWLWLRLISGRSFFGITLYDVPGLGPSLDNFRKRGGQHR